MMKCVFCMRYRCAALCTLIGLSVVERNRLVDALYGVPTIDALTPNDCRGFMRFLKRAKVVSP